MIIGRQRVLLAVVLALTSAAAGLWSGEPCMGEDEPQQFLSLGTRGSLIVTDDGSFGLVNGRQLIGPSSHWTVRLGDQLLAPGTPAFSDALAAPMRRGEESFRLLLVSGMVFIELTFEASGGTAILTATAVNAGTATVPVAIRCALDIRAAQIGLDGSGVITRETSFAPGDYSQLIGYDEAEPSLSASLPEAPLQVELVSTPDIAVGSQWDFPVNPNLELGDSTGALIFWPQMLLRPHGYCRDRVLLSAGPAEGVAYPQNRLSIGGIDISPVSGFEERTRTVNVTMVNFGPDVDVDLAVLFLKEGTPFTAKFIPVHLAWNLTETIRLSWTPYIVGNYTVCAILPFHDDGSPMDNARTEPAFVVVDNYRFVMRFSGGDVTFTNTSHSGARIPVRVYVNNTGNASDIIRLSIENLPGAWNAFLSADQVRLDINQHAYTDITVKVPIQAQLGLFVFYVVGTSDGDGGSQALQVVIEIGLPPSTATDPRSQPLTPGISGPQNDTPPVEIRPYKVGTGNGNAPIEGGSRSNLALAGLAVAAAVGVIAVALYQAAGLRTLTVMQKIIKRALYGLATGDEYRKTIYEAYSSMCAHLAKYGYSRQDHVTPREFARAMKLALPLDTESIRALTRLFEEARYSDHSLGERSRRSAIENLRHIEKELDKLTTYEDHPSPLERMRRAMGWKNN